MQFRTERPFWLQRRDQQAGLDLIPMPQIGEWPRIPSCQLLRLVPAGEEMPSAIELFDLSGRLIRTVDLSDALVGHSVEDFAAGNYLIRLVFEDRTQSIRWMKG